jgi:hypothetical protein
MKGRTFVFMSMLMAAASTMTMAASPDLHPSRNPAWVGVWNGELDGQPSVKLTLGDDTGELGGTVVFNLIKKENGKARIAGSDTHVLMHPQLAGDTLTFQVIRNSDLRQLEMKVQLETSGKAKLQCLNCGENPAVAELVRVQ